MRRSTGPARLVIMAILPLASRAITSPAPIPVMIATSPPVGAMCGLIMRRSTAGARPAIMAASPPASQMAISRPMLNAMIVTAQPAGSGSLTAIPRGPSPVAIPAGLIAPIATGQIRRMRPIRRPPIGPIAQAAMPMISGLMSIRNTKARIRFSIGWTSCAIVPALATNIPMPR